MVAKIKRPPTPPNVVTAMAREEMQRMVVKPDLTMAYAAALLRAKELGTTLSDHNKSRAHALAGVILAQKRSKTR